MKVLGDGELTKKLNVTAHRFSGSAQSKIEAAGGTVVALNPKPEAGDSGQFSSGDED